MHRVLLPALLFASACVTSVRGEDGQIYVLVVDDFSLSADTTCEENFNEYDCENEIDDVDPEGPVITQESSVSGPRFTVILLDQGHDCPILVIDDVPVFGRVTDNGYRYDWSGFDTTTRDIEDPSGWMSMYEESLTDEWTLRLNETDDKGVFNWTLTETFTFDETATFTDTVGNIDSLQTPAPDPFYWPVNGLVYTGKDYYFVGYAPDEDDCEGDDCFFRITRALTIEARGQAKFAALLSQVDDVGPFDWSGDAGVDESPTFLSLGINPSSF